MTRNKNSVLSKGRWVNYLHIIIAIMGKDTRFYIRKLNVNKTTIKSNDFLILFL